MIQDGILYLHTGEDPLEHWIGRGLVPSPQWYESASYFLRPGLLGSKTIGMSRHRIGASRLEAGKTSITRIDRGDVSSLYWKSVDMST